MDKELEEAKQQQKIENEKKKERINKIYNKKYGDKVPPAKVVDLKFYEETSFLDR